MGKSSRERNQESPEGHNGTHRYLKNGLGLFSLGLGVAELVSPRGIANFIGVEDDDRNRTLLRLYGLRELASGVGILSQRNPSGWMWARVAGDALDLSTLGKAMASEGAAPGSKTGVATAAVLGLTALDVLCARQLSSRPSGKRSVEKPSLAKSITINRPPEEVYNFWRDFRNLPRIHNHLESVEVTGANRSHWILCSPVKGRKVEWDAEVTDEQPHSRIAWRSLSSRARHSGAVRFERANEGPGTEVNLEMNLHGIGSKLRKLFATRAEHEVTEALRNLKRILETEETARPEASIPPQPNEA